MAKLYVVHSDGIVTRFVWAQDPLVPIDESAIYPDTEPLTPEGSAGNTPGDDESSSEGD
jgi:hypothetical protein